MSLELHGHLLLLFYLRCLEKAYNPNYAFRSKFYFSFSESNSQLPTSYFSRLANKITRHTNAFSAQLFNLCMDVCTRYTTYDIKRKTKCPRQTMFTKWQQLEKQNTQNIEILNSCISCSLHLYLGMFHVIHYMFCVRVTNISPFLCNFSYNFHTYKSPLCLPFGESKGYIMRVTKALVTQSAGQHL